MKSAQASGTTAMSEERLQQLCNQHGLYTWAEGQALAYEICRLRSAPAQPSQGDVERAREWLQANGYALWLTANSDSFPRCVAAYADSETAALRAEDERVTIDLESLSRKVLELRAENKALQALVTICERDIGLALADYHDSQAQVREWKARQAESFAFYEDEVRQLESCRAQLAQMREALERWPE